MKPVVLIGLFFFAPITFINGQAPRSTLYTLRNLTLEYGNYLSEGEEFKIGFDTEGVIYAFTNKRILFIYSKENSYSVMYGLIRHFDLIDANDIHFYCNIELYPESLNKDNSIGTIRIARPVDPFEVQRILMNGIGGL